jgi:hypothetical protein
MKNGKFIGFSVLTLGGIGLYAALKPKTKTSTSNSANTTETPTIVQAPYVSSNPTALNSGVSVTFNATNVTGVVHWFKNGAYVAEGVNYTVSNPTQGDIYTAKCFFNNIYSDVSTGFTIGSPVVVITVPAPVITSNPTNVTAGTSVTFTATIQNGINQWLKNGVYLSDGLTLTVSNPTQGDIYTSKCFYQNTYSVPSNAITVQAAPTVAAPTLTANPTNVVAGTSVTFTAGNVLGTHKFYKNGVFLQDSNTLTVANPTANDVYTGKNFQNSILSAASNAITVQANNSGITITEPNKPALFFSNNQPASYYNNTNNLPAIFQNTPTYDPVNEVVWMSNATIKVGINLRAGGHICYLSDINSNVNLVQNGYDKGRQICIDAYQRQDGYTQNGKVSRTLPNGGGNPASYNTTQGGDFMALAGVSGGHSPSLIDYKRVGNSYYVKVRPLFYTMDSEFAQVYIEATYTLLERSVKMEVTYTSFRTDNQFTGGGFDGAAFPACFVIDPLNRYKCYTGANPWTNDSLDTGVIPIVNQGQAELGRQLTENWVMAHKPDNSVAVGFCTPNNGQSIYSHIKQLEVGVGNPAGTEYTGGFTYIDTNHDFTIADRSNYAKTMVSYISTGTPAQVQSEFNRLHSIGLV